MEIGLRLLEYVDYYSNDRTTQELQKLGAKIKKATNDSFERVYFAGFTPPGKSGAWITTQFRYAMNIKEYSYDKKFIYLSQLDEYQILYVKNERPPEKRYFVFLDDYIGTGESAIVTWQNIQSQTNETDEYYVATLACTDVGLGRIRNEAHSLNVIYERTIPFSSSVLHPKNKTFTAAEKDRIRQYCRKA